MEIWVRESDLAGIEEGRTPKVENLCTRRRKRRSCHVDMENAAVEKNGVHGIILYSK